MPSTMTGIRPTLSTESPCRFRWCAFAHHCLLLAAFPLFLGIALFRLVPNHTHNVGLMPVIVEGILHRLPIHRQRVVLGAPGLIPCIERQVQRPRFNPYHAVANHKFAGNDIASVLTPAAKPLAGFLPRDWAQSEMPL